MAALLVGIAVHGLMFARLRDTQGRDGGDRGKKMLPGREEPIRPRERSSEIERRNEENHHRKQVRESRRRSPEDSAHEHARTSVAQRIRLLDDAQEGGKRRINAQHGPPPIRTARR